MENPSWKNPDSINQRVSDKLLKRAEMGRSKYGVTMDRNDLKYRDWLLHLQEELLDGAVYIEKLLHGNRDENA
jgi:hypothetical protein